MTVAPRAPKHLRNEALAQGQVNSIILSWFQKALNHKSHESELRCDHDLFQMIP